MAELFSGFTGKKIIMFGTGVASKKVTEYFLGFNVDTSYYVDNNNEKWGTSFCDRPVYSPDVLLQEDQSGICIVIASSYVLEISSQLEGMGFSAEKHFLNGLSMMNSVNHFINGEADLVKKLIKPGHTVFDIGANTGKWSEMLLENQKECQLHLFEPVADTFNLLMQHVGGYMKDVMMRFNNIALSKENGMLDFFHYDTESTWSTFYRRIDVEKKYGLQAPQKYVVQASTVDNYCIANKVRHIHFMKINVEGSELDVLVGAQMMLGKGMIDYIQFEYGDTYEAANITLRDVYDLLDRFDYRVFTISALGLKEIHDVSEVIEDYEYKNFLAVNSRLVSHLKNEKPSLLDIGQLCVDYEINPKGVIHIGAHEGKELAAYKKIGVEKVLFIEANPEVYRLLEQRVAGESIEIRTVNCAISDVDGDVELHITNQDQSSSILPLKKHKDIYPEIQELKKVKVASNRLDTLLENYKLDSKDYNLLNIDIQGAELLALKGAHNLLVYIDALNIEVNFEELYEGCPLIDEIDAFLDGYGFKRVVTKTPYHPSWGDAFYVKKPTIAMSSLGQNGRFANQLFQYAYIKIYSKINDFRLETPEWVGQSLFDIHDNALSKSYLQIDETDLVTMDHPFRKSETNVDIKGFFQFHTKNYRPYKTDFQLLFKPKKDIEARLKTFVDQLRSKGNTIVGLHLRRGDYGYSHFFEAPSKWYLEWLDLIWSDLDRPLLYIASDEPDKVLEDFAEYNPVTAASLGVSLPEAEYYPDFYFLSNCDVLAISNSSFSFAASMLNTHAMIYSRPSLAHQKMIPYDPWNSPVLLRDHKVEDNIKAEMVFKFDNIDHNQKILIYGAGEHTMHLLKETNISNKIIIGIVDQDPQLEEAFGFKVYRPEQINQLDSDVIIISSFRYRKSIEQFLQNTIGYHGEIINIYKDIHKRPFYQ